MRVYQWQQRLGYLWVTGMKSYYWNMFNGVEKRIGPGYVGCEPVFSQDKEKFPLLAIFNAYKISHVMSPGLNLIVSQTVKDELKEIKDICYLQVQIEKVIYEEYRYGDSWEGSDVENEYIRKLPNSKKHRDALEKYYEIVPADIRRIKSEGKAKEYALAENADGETESILLSKSMFQKNPVITTYKSGRLLREDIHGVIKKYANTLIYAIQEIEV